MKQVEYNQKTKNLVMLPQIKTQTYGARSITVTGSILWGALTGDIIAGNNVAVFNKNVIACKGHSCSCNLCS